MRPTRRPSRAAASSTSWYRSRYTCPCITRRLAPTNRKDWPSSAKSAPSTRTKPVATAAASASPSTILRSQYVEPGPARQLDLAGAEQVAVERIGLRLGETQAGACGQHVDVGLPLERAAPEHAGGLHHHAAGGQGRGDQVKASGPLAGPVGHLDPDAHVAHRGRHDEREMARGQGHAVDRDLDFD